MRKGGYKIVDFKGAELTSNVIVRPGIYSQIIDDYDKPILVSGVSLGGSLRDDAYASVNEITGDSGDSVELGVYGGTITVTEDDEVTYVPAKSSAELTAEIGDLNDLETTDKDSLVDAINEVKNLFITEEIPTSGVSVEGGSISDYTVNCAKTGYTAIGILGTAITSGGACTLVTSFLSNPTTATVRIRNNGTSAVTPNTIILIILYKKI